MAKEKEIKKRKKSNGEGSINTTTRKGKTYYRSSVTVGIDSEGKQIRKTFGSYKKSTVVDKMNKARYEYKEKNISSSDVSFGQLFKTWIYDFKKVEVSNNTFAEYEVCYRLRVEPYPISRIKAKDITLQDLQTYFNSLQNDFTPNTIKKTYTKVNSCLSFGVIQNTIFKNYCPGVTIQKVKKEKELNVFSREEQDKIIGSLDLKNVLDRMIYFVLFTGLRLGEVSGLKWEDVNGNILKVRRQWQKDITFVNGKRILKYMFKDILKNDNAERNIPLPNKAIEVLDLCLKDCEVIFGIDGQPVEPKRPRRRLKSICKKLNIPPRRFHALRHSYATRLFELDVPIKTVQVLLGHSEIATTMDIYTHVMMDKKMEVLDKLNSM